MRRFGFIGLVVIGIVMFGTAFAQENVTRITPIRAVDANPIETIRASEQLAEGEAEGAGRWLRIEYRSTSELVGLVAPFRTGTAYEPKEMLQFILPAAAEGSTVDIDLAVGPRWSPGNQRYFLAFSSSTTGDFPEILGIGFVPATMLDSASALWSQLLKREPFIISTYHFLQGYRLLGVPLAVLVAVVLVIVCSAYGVLHREQAAYGLVVIALLFHLSYGVKVGLDLARITAADAAAWIATGEYGEAKSTYSIVDALEKKAGVTSLAVCTDSTDYEMKLMRYFLHPLPVSLVRDEIITPSHVVVLKKIEWSFVNGRLKCGSIDMQAERVATFPNGSELFRRIP